MDCDSKGCGFESHYLPLYELYLNLLGKNKQTNVSYTYLQNSKITLKPESIKTLVKNNVVKSKKLDNFKVITLFKPKNQLFLTLKLNKIFTYSTGLIVKSSGLESRSQRRNKIGNNILMAFLLKRINSLNTGGKIIFTLKTFKNINNFKNSVVRLISNLGTEFQIILQISKNYTKHNFKKISSIKKKIRKSSLIE